MVTFDPDRAVLETWLKTRKRPAIWRGVPLFRLAVTGNYRERWLMKDSSAILLFWSGKMSQPRI